MISKQARQYAIKELITSSQLPSQDRLRKELKRRGIVATQATLSRDLKELGANLALAGGKRVYVLQPETEVQSLRPIVGAEVLSITANESVIVVRTLPGCAATIGEYVDLMKNPDIIGTVAGDNTLLVVPAAQRRTAMVLEFLKNTLIEGK